LSIDLAYAELGLTPGATEPEVKAAWRRLVARWHPDRNASDDAVDLMQRINRAYEQIRLTGFIGEQRDGVPAGGARANAPGAAPAAESPRRTLHRKVRLSLEEAALGCTKVLRGRLTDICNTCSGHGALQSAAPCAGCAGRGTVSRPAWFGWLHAHSDCSACDGSGTVRPTCADCNGEGKRSTAYRRKVRIPVGVRHGDVLSAERGGKERDDFDGTLELQIEIAAHSLFSVGDDGTLRCEMPVDGFAWLAGAWIDVPTLTGVQQMRLQRGRHVYRLREQGLPLERRGTLRGDFIVTVVPAFPDTLSDEQQALLDKLARSSGRHDGEAAAGPIHAWRCRLQAWDRRRTAASAAQ
jgi:molecular chaperone DnaJ